MTGNLVRVRLTESAVAQVQERIEATGGDRCSAEEEVMIERESSRLPTVASLKLCPVDRIALWIEERAGGAGGLSADVCFLLDERSRISAELGRPERLLEASVSWTLGDANERPDFRVLVYVPGPSRRVSVAMSPYGKREQCVVHRATVFRSVLAAAGMLDSATIVESNGRVSVNCDRPFKVEEWSIDQHGPTQLMFTPFETLNAQMELSRAIVDGVGQPILSNGGMFELNVSGYTAWREELSQIDSSWRLDVLASLHPAADVIWSGVWPVGFDWIPLGEWSERDCTIRVDAVSVDGEPVLEFRGYSESQPLTGCGDTELRRVLADIIDP